MNDSSQAGLRTYISGFVLSLVLTLSAYFLVVDHALSHAYLLGAVIGLALIQFIVQATCFLHLGSGAKPGWKLATFAGMIVVVVIIVGGSLWIMNNLNYHMTPTEIQNYMNSQDGF